MYGSFKVRDLLRTTDLPEFRKFYECSGAFSLRNGRTVGTWSTIQANGGLFLHGREHIRLSDNLIKYKIEQKYTKNKLTV